MTLMLAEKFSAVKKNALNLGVIPPAFGKCWPRSAFGYSCSDRRFLALDIAVSALTTDAAPPNLRARVLGSLQTQGETFPQFFPIPTLKFFSQAMKALKVQPGPGCTSVRSWVRRSGFGNKKKKIKYLFLVKYDPNVSNAASEGGAGMGGALGWGGTGMAGRAPASAAGIGVWFFRVRALPARTWRAWPCQDVRLPLGLTAHRPMGKQGGWRARRATRKVANRGWGG